MKLDRLKELIESELLKERSAILPIDRELLAALPGLLRVCDAHRNVLRREAAQRHASSAFWTDERHEATLAKIDRLANEKLEELLG